MSQKTKRRRYGFGSVELRGKMWWIAFYINGRRVRESSHSTKKADAKELLKERLVAVQQGTFHATAAHTTFRDLEGIIRTDYHVQGRRSVRSLEGSLTNLRTFFGEDEAQTITLDRMNRYVELRLEDGAAHATVRKEIAALKRAFNLAKRAGRVHAVPPFPQIVVRNTREGFPEPDEVARILSHLDEDLQPMIRFLDLTGWRVSEAQGLEWGQVDLTAGIIRLEGRQTKNERARTFPTKALPELQALLEAQRERTTELERATGQVVRHLFHRRGRQILDFRTAWKTATAEAGVPHRLVHDLRRGAVRRLERAGVARSVAMQLTGHRTESVYARYAITNEADLAAGLEKVARLTENSPPTGTVVPFKSQ